METEEMPSWWNSGLGQYDGTEDRRCFHFCGVVTKRKIHKYIQFVFVLGFVTADNTNIPDTQEARPE
jgi:hypothetical protein